MAEENEQEVYRPYVAELADKRGYIHPIHAKQLAEERTVTMTGDVTGSANWDFGEPATTGQSSESMALTIGNKKVTTDKIDDKAVGSGQMADHSVGLTQIDTNAITSTATSTGADKDKLITSEGVRNAIDNAIEGRGIDYGPMTVDQINALTDIPTGSTAHIIAGGTATVITDGDLPVRVGEDVKYHISGNSHGWYSLDGEFKLKQTAKTDPTASGTTITAIDSITQNENGEITATKKTIRTGNASDTGVVKLSDSHTSDSSTNGGVAATPAAVKAAYDLAAGKKDKQTPLDTDTGSGSGKGGTTKTLTRLVQDADGAITPTFSNIADASGSSKGLMSSADYTKLAGIAEGAEVNQNAFGNVKVGDVTVAADSKTDTLEIVGGTGIDATGDATNDKVTVALDSATQTSLGKADSAVQSVKINGGSELKDASGNVNIPIAVATGSTGAKAGALSADDKKKINDLGTAAFKNVPESGNASSTEVVLGSDTRLSAGASAVQDVTVDGASVVNSSTKVAAVPNASTSAKGAVQLAGSIGATVASENNKAATEKAVRDAINALDAEVTSNDGTNVQVRVTEADGKISAVNVTTDNTENKNNKVSAWQTTPDDTHFPSEKLVKDSLDAKADKAGFVDANDGKWIGVTPNRFSGGNGYWKICSFSAGAYWTLEFEVEVTNWAFDTNIFERKIISIYGYNANAVSEAVEVRCCNSLVFSSRGYGNIIYYAIDNDVISLYVKTYNVANYTQFMRLKSIVNQTKITDLTWYTSSSLGTQPTNPVKFTESFSASRPGGSASVPVFVSSSGVVTECTDDFVHDADVAGFVTGPSSATADDIAVFDGATGKIVKDGGKKISDLALANDVVAIGDAIVRAQGNGSIGWYKIASRAYSNSLSNTIGANWSVTIFSASKNITLSFNIDLNVRTNTSGKNLAVRIFRSSPIGAISSDQNIDDFKIAIQGTSELFTIELWYNAGGSWESMVIRELEVSTFTGNLHKSNWTYYSNTSGSPDSVDEPTATISQRIEWYYAKQLQTAVTDPTASGTALSFIDSITQNENGEITPTKKSVTVDSTYSASGTNPVNGTAVAAAIATSLTDVEYVAAQSGGGGNLNKTKNGSTSSVLAFMSDAEAIDLWRTAWDEAD